MMQSFSFNQDASCLAVGTEAGITIFNAEPFGETFKRDMRGGVGQVEMIYRCNILALVGGGRNPAYPPSKVMIWDDHRTRFVGELSFRTEVRAVRLRRDRIVVALEHKVYVYNFADLKLLHQVETLANPRGLVAVSSDPGPAVLACPGLHRGEVRCERPDTRRARFIAAHESPLAALALSSLGHRLATASEKGTLVRVWDAETGGPLWELRRGADPAAVHCLCFSPVADWLVLTSDKGTVHVYPLGPRSGATGEGSRGEASADGRESESAGPPATPPGRQRGWALGWGRGESASLGREVGGGGSGALSFLRGLLPKYFSSAWSFAQFRLPDDGRAVAAFGASPHTVLVATAAGGLHRVGFDPTKGGECTQLSYHAFGGQPSEPESRV